MSEEFQQWSTANAGHDPADKCLCGGTFARHRLCCPLYPPHGYDLDDNPHEECQLPRVMYELGRKMGRKYNEAIMKLLEAE